MNRKLLAPFALVLAAATFFLFTQSILVAAPAAQEAPPTAADSAAIDVMTPTVTISPSVRIQIRQQIPFTATLAAMLSTDDGITATATVTPTTTLTEAVAAEAAVEATTPATDAVPIADDQVVTFLLDLALDFVVSETMTTTVPATLTIMLADGMTNTVTGTLPISLEVGVSPTAQVTVTALSLLPTETVTASEGVTAVEAVTLPATITDVEAVTLPATITATAPVTLPATITPTDTLTESATPVPAGEADAGPDSVQATTTTTANVRVGPTTNDEIADTLPAGATVELVGVTEDGLWYLLSTGTWLFNTLADPAPTDLPLATPELIAQLEEQAAAETTPETTPEPAAEAPTETSADEAPAAADTPPAGDGSTSTVTVDANLRAGPSTEFEVIGGTVTDQAITVIGQNEAGDWYLLDNGGWVFATLVADPPADVPVVPDDATPESVGATETAPTGLAILPTPTPGAADATEATAESEPLTADETLYVDQVNVIAQRLQTTAATVTELIATAAADATLLEDGTWQGQLETAGQVLTRVGEEIRTITAPERFAGAQIDLESAIGSFDQVAELLTQGLADADLTTLQQAVAEFEVGTVLLRARTGAVAVITNLS